ncbi:MAG: PDZ domain-containing protein [Verrucomicrobiaceae bacterium]|nr:PDZ domain-containing protein [Verrucomicrobiaceae bacterium]
MITRFTVVLLLVLPGAGSHLSAGEQALSTVTVLWNSEVRSPGICVDRTSWFVSVIPAAVPLEGLTTTRLRHGELTTEARVLFRDDAQRLCLLETSTPLTGLTPVSLVHTGELKGGQKLHCLSHRSACLTTVAGKDWSHRGERFSMPLLRVRVADPESFCAAGTPLVSEEGHLVGILTGKDHDETGDVHAIPVARVRKLVTDIKTHQRSGPVRVGLVFHNQSSTPEIIEVKSGSPAERSGLEAGDVILSIDGTDTESLEDLVEVIHNLPAGVETPVTVLRGLSEKDLSIVPEFLEMTAAAR